MSDYSQDQAHEEAHTGPIKNPKQLLIASVFAFVAPVAIIIGLVYFVSSGNKSVDSDLAVAQRIQKVGQVEVRDANRPLRTGEDVFKGQCSACHATGVSGAPKFGDAGAWGPRIGAGFDALLNSALKGKNLMGAQGGGEFSDFEIGRAVVYMANAGGAKFPEPKAPAANGAAQ